jgi:phosphoribosylanthranilate isomerase
MTAVKICGLTRPEDVALACALGASYVGLNFSSVSPRRVALGSARELADAAGGAVRVGVFVDESEEEVARAVELARLDWIQRHRPVSRAEAQRLPRPLLAVVHVGHGGPAELPEGVAPFCRAVLFDTAGGAAPGGTGAAFDWRQVASRRPGPPVFLAGGLTPENVGAAIAMVRPDGVDVASGVEFEPGRKDPDRLRRFFEAVREADEHAARHAV